MTPLPDIQDLVSKRDQILGYQRALLRQKEDLDAEIRVLEEKEHVEQASAELLRVLISEEVSEGLEAIETLETEGLQKIFPDKNLAVESEITEKRGKVSVELYTKDTKVDGTVVRDQCLNSFGGSVSTVESVLLRTITTMRRGLAPLLVMDETLAAIAKTYVEKTAEFLRLLCERVPGGMDILVITHDPLVIDGAHKAYSLEQGKDGEVKLRVRKAA